MLTRSCSGTAFIPPRPATRYLRGRPQTSCGKARRSKRRRRMRSEEHTSELQSLAYLVCRLLLEKKKHAKPTVSLRLQRRIRQTLSRHPPRPLSHGGHRHSATRILAAFLLAPTITVAHLLNTSPI